MVIPGMPARMCVGGYVVCVSDHSHTRSATTDKSSTRRGTATKQDNDAAPQVPTKVNTRGARLRP